MQIWWAFLQLAYKKETGGAAWCGLTQIELIEVRQTPRLLVRPKFICSAKCTWRPTAHYAVLCSPDDKLRKQTIHFALVATYHGKPRKTWSFRACTPWSCIFLPRAPCICKLFLRNASRAGFPRLCARVGINALLFTRQKDIAAGVRTALFSSFKYSRALVYTPSSIYVRRVLKLPDFQAVEKYRVSGKSLSLAISSVYEQIAYYNIVAILPSMEWSQLVIGADITSNK